MVFLPLHPFPHAQNHSGVSLCHPLQSQVEIISCSAFVYFNTLGVSKMQQEKSFLLSSDLIKQGSSGMDSVNLSPSKWASAFYLTQLYHISTCTRNTLFTSPGTYSSTLSWFLISCQSNNSSSTQWAWTRKVKTCKPVQSWKYLQQLPTSMYMKWISLKLLIKVVFRVS